MAFEAQSMPFPSTALSDTALELCPITWWHSQRNPVPEEYLKLMPQLHSATASSSSNERVFSTFGLIHAKLRNRLGITKSSEAFVLL